MWLFRNGTTRCRVILAGMALLVPYLVFTEWQAIRDAQTNVLDWANDSLPAATSFREFRERFGCYEYIVVSHPACGHDDPHAQRIAADLRESPLSNHFRSITTSQEMIDRLTEGDSGIPKGSISERLRGFYLGQDGSQGCLIIELSDEGSQNRTASVNAILQSAESMGVEAAELQVAGVASDLAWLDREGVAAPMRLAPLSALVVIFVACYALHSIRLGIVLSTLSLLAGLVPSGLLQLCGMSFDAVSSTLPTLGLLMTASLSLHWISYYGRSPEDLPIGESLGSAWLVALRPTVLSALTTCFGLLSLSFSQTSAIRNFGVLGAATTGVSLLLAMFVLPAILRVARISYQANEQEDKIWEGVSAQVRRHRWAILAVSFVTIGAAAAGLSQLETGVRLNNFFGEDHPSVQESRWLETNIGKLASLELVVFVPPVKSEANERDGQAKAVERDGERMLRGLELLYGINRELRELNTRIDTFSALNVLPSVPGRQRAGFSGIIAKRMYASGLEDSRDLLADNGLFSQERDGDYWRLTMRVSALQSENASDYETQAQQLRQAARQVVDAHSADSSVSFSVTGLPLLFEQIERQFMDDLIITYSMAVLMIFLGVWAGLRNLKLSLLAMLPNICPPLVVLGIVGWTGQCLEVGSVMTASIALGIAVDDTMHLLFWVDRKTRDGIPMRQAVSDALSHCGRPVLQTSILGGCGLAILGLSPFLPTARFGLLIAGMLITAIFADLLLLPALLSTRFGEWTIIRSRESEPE